MSELHRWKKEATQNDWEVLASLSQTTTGYLDQIAYRFRRPSVDIATRISNATKNLQFKHIKPVTKESLVFIEIKTKSNAA